MVNTAYNIQLKGYVGEADFLLRKRFRRWRPIDKLLVDHSGKPVNELIDSLGGSLATGLSISATLKENGKVCVHFASLNASAATIASLGLAHISISTGAMYHVYKCFIDLFSVLQSAIGDNEVEQF